jgi:hypothetical protein
MKPAVLQSLSKMIFVPAVEKFRAPKELVWPCSGCWTLNLLGAAVATDARPRNKSAAFMVSRRPTTKYSFDEDCNPNFNSSKEGSSTQEYVFKQIVYSQSPHFSSALQKIHRADKMPNFGQDLLRFDDDNSNEAHGYCEGFKRA